MKQLFLLQHRLSSSPPYDHARDAPDPHPLLRSQCPHIAPETLPSSYLLGCARGVADVSIFRLLAPSAIPLLDSDALPLAPAAASVAAMPLAANRRRLATCRNLQLWQLLT